MNLLPMTGSVAAAAAACRCRRCSATASTTALQVPDKPSINSQREPHKAPADDGMKKIIMLSIDTHITSGDMLHGRTSGRNPFGNAVAAVGKKGGKDVRFKRRKAAP